VGLAVTTIVAGGERTMVVFCEIPLAEAVTIADDATGMLAGAV
jgi:hypothetical protein